MTADVARLPDLVRSGPLWGAELDAKFRVLALTIEPSADSHPDPEATDRRLQVLLHPVSAIAASLVQETDEGPTVLRFTEEQLPDVVAALGGPVPSGPVLADAPVDLNAVRERLSLHGQATVGDGVTHHLHLHAAAEDLTLDLWASFDTMELKSP